MLSQPLHSERTACVGVALRSASHKMLDQRYIGSGNNETRPIPRDGPNSCLFLTFDPELNNGPSKLTDLSVRITLNIGEPVRSFLQSHLDYRPNVRLAEVCDMLYEV